MREHGTRAKYVVEKCHCFKCRLANNTYREWLERQHLYGRPVLVETEVALAHIHLLQSYGLGVRQIAARAGLWRNAVRDVVTGETKRIRPETEKAILGVECNPEVLASDGTYIDATKTWRRIHALEALGYAKSWIAREAGLGSSIQLRTDRVTARNARKIKLLAESVGDTRGPNDRARRRAAMNGYKVPAWYDDDFELPETDPEETALNRQLREELIEEVARLNRAGLTGKQIAWKLEIGERKVQRYLAKAREREVA